MLKQTIDELRYKHVLNPCQSQFKTRFRVAKILIYFASSQEYLVESKKYSILFSSHCDQRQVKIYAGEGKMLRKIFSRCKCKVLLDLNSLMHVQTWKSTEFLLRHGQARTTTESALIDDGTSTEMVYFYWFGLLSQM